MSPQQYHRAVEKQLKKLNEEIDSKIVRGESYSRESRLHKMLREKIKRARTPGFFNRLCGQLFIKA